MQYVSMAVPRSIFKKRSDHHPNMTSVWLQAWRPLILELWNVCEQCSRPEWLRMDSIAAIWYTVDSLEGCRETGTISKNYHHMFHVWPRWALVGSTCRSLPESSSLRFAQVCAQGRAETYLLALWHTNGNTRIEERPSLVQHLAA